MRTANRPRSHGRLATFMRKAEREYLIQTMRACRGSSTRLALALGLTRRGLLDKMRAYGLTEEAGVLRAASSIPGPQENRPSSRQRGREAQGLRTTTDLTWEEIAGRLGFGSGPAARVAARKAEARA